ncbi:cbb3-type cytochrome oxidase assembly protein CcoS [Sphingomonas sp. XMGL2]|uniref:Cbb3-type cytochrome oxidase assembly protein CcoS n=1 Tax=Sphingomonas quercus TaxID=2842451 RepID=A0ABS6BM28_9SPHN|nr:cbb3-type cytochrome oxidase assembly protein CcoS [Sphingomonas quercus]MBU3079366.1 cbb3-type cytochrome oxidase assembly protein CcoS [Sphingomonas quercus]
MNGLAFLIPVALLLGLSGLGAFFWSLSSGQFDDLDGAAVRILIDDENRAGGAGDAPPAQGNGSDRQKRRP